MVTNGTRSSGRRERDSTWLWVSLALIIGVAVTVYVLRSPH
jgi:bacteriorhodopsin